MQIKKRKRLYSRINYINQINKDILLGALYPNMPNLLIAIAIKLNNYYTSKNISIHWRNRKNS